MRRQPKEHGVPYANLKGPWDLGSPTFFCQWSRHLAERNWNTVSWHGWPYMERDSKMLEQIHHVFTRRIGHMRHIGLQQMLRANGLFFLENPWGKGCYDSGFRDHLGPGRVTGSLWGLIPDKVKRTTKKKAKSIVREYVTKGFRSVSFAIRVVNKWK